MALYGAEMWTVTQAVRERLEASEMSLEENRQDQLGGQSNQRRSSSESTRKQEYFRYIGTK